MPSSLTQQGWLAAGASVLGRHHETSSLPNQDAWGWRRLASPAGAERLVLAVSDGHGGASYFRSDRGARFAVDCALDCFEQLSQSPEWNVRDAQVSAGGFPGMLLPAWEARVLRDLLGDPFRREELERLVATPGDGGEEAALRVLRHGVKAYGATLLLVFVDSREGWVVIQAGDGDVVVVAADGRAREVVEHDPKLFANQTTSLSSLDPMIFRMASGTDIADVRGILAGTDGVKNSWADENQYLRFQAGVVEEARKLHPESFAERLTGWLHRMATTGACDDTTLGLLANSAAPELAPPPVAEGDTSTESTDKGATPGHSEGARED